jgi:hypothetical protein
VEKQLIISPVIDNASRESLREKIEKKESITSGFESDSINQGKFCAIRDVSHRQNIICIVS